jgi:hypothetical protein
MTVETGESERRLKMNTKNRMPGFTAENAILKTMAPYRTASVFDSRSSPTYVQPAAIDPCTNLAEAFIHAPVDSFEENVYITAYFSAGCGGT